jgi:D-3-phosphoglycerate dehydrogenase
MKNRRFVATAPIGEPAISILEGVAPLETASTPDVDTIIGMRDGMIGLVCRGEGGANRRTIEACDALQVIGRTGVGYDSVDVDAATERHIPVIIAPKNDFAVAEGALAMLLSLIKLLPLADRAVKDGNWQWRYSQLTGDMTGKTLGLIGVGRIGRKLARLVKPFDVTVIAFDPYADVDTADAMQVELDELISRSDFISLHTPLNDETRGMINAERIAQMKAGVILINTSRGAVVESLDVLADALDSGQLAAVGLDVFPVEPPDASHRIFRDPRCLCAPHQVGTSELAMYRIYESMANDMVAVIEGREPNHCVNPQVLK